MLYQKLPVRSPCSIAARVPARLPAARYPPPPPPCLRRTGLCEVFTWASPGSVAAALERHLQVVGGPAPAQARILLQLLQAALRHAQLVRHPGWVLQRLAAGRGSTAWVWGWAGRAAAHTGSRRWRRQDYRIDGRKSTQV